MRNPRGISSESVIFWCEADGRGWQTGEETKDEKKKLEEGLQRFGCFVPDGERLLGVRLLQQGTGGGRRVQVRL